MELLMLLGPVMHAGARLWSILFAQLEDIDFSAIKMLSLAAVRDVEDEKRTLWENEGQLLANKWAKAGADRSQPRYPPPSPPLPGCWPTRGLTV